MQQVQLLGFMLLTMFVTAPIMAVGGLVMALREDVVMSGLLLVVLPALVVSIGLIIRQMRPLFRLMQGRVDRINGVMREQIMGIRVIRAFVKEDEETERLDSEVYQLIEAEMRRRGVLEDSASDDDDVNDEENNEDAKRTSPHRSAATRRTSSSGALGDTAIRLAPKAAAMAPQLTALHVDAENRERGGVNNVLGSALRRASITAAVGAAASVATTQ